MTVRVADSQDQQLSGRVQNLPHDGEVFQPPVPAPESFHAGLSIAAPSPKSARGAIHCTAVRQSTGVGDGSGRRVGAAYKATPFAGRNTMVQS